MTTLAYPSASDLIWIIAKTQFRPFDKGDWQTFSDCSTSNPMIGEYGDAVIVVDGDQINVIKAEDEYGGALYSMIKY